MGEGILQLPTWVTTSTSLQLFLRLPTPERGEKSGFHLKLLLFLDTSTVDTSAPAVTDGTEVMDTSEGQSVLGTEWKREGAAYTGIGFNQAEAENDGAIYTCLRISVGCGREKVNPAAWPPWQ